MFKTLLLTTIVGAGAAHIPAPDVLPRSNNPPSYLCSSVNKKCAQGKQISSVSAYCSTYLNIPKTTTKTISKCSTTTKTITQTTATVTQASTVTSTITGCIRPSSAPASGAPSGGDSSAPAPEGKRDAIPEAAQRHDRAVPACLAAYKKTNEMSSACSCLNLKPQSTITKTVMTTIKTATRTVQTASTVQGEPTTTTVYEIGASPTFAISRESDAFLITGLSRNKLSQSGLFNDDASLDDAILFQLNNPGGLSGQAVILNDRDSGVANGSPLGVRNDLSDDQTNPRSAYEVRFNSRASRGDTEPNLVPLTCSISQSPTDGTCPLSCQAVGTGDANQDPTSRSWYLGPAGAVSSDTFRTFAVTASNDTPAQQPEDGTVAQPGPDVERGQSGDGNKKR